MYLPIPTGIIKSRTMFQSDQLQYFYNKRNKIATACKHLFLLCNEIILWNFAIIFSSTAVRKLLLLVNYYVA